VETCIQLKSLPPHHPHTSPRVEISSPTSSTHKSAPTPADPLKKETHRGALLVARMLIYYYIHIFRLPNYLCNLLIIHFNIGPSFYPMN